MNDGFDEFMKEYKKINKKGIRWDNVAEKCQRMYHASIRKKLRKLPKLNATRLEVEQCLDLLGAIFEYRKQPNLDIFLLDHPELLHQKKYAIQLWHEFSTKSQEEMSIMVKEMLDEIDLHLEGVL